MSAAPPPSTSVPLGALCAVQRMRAAASAPIFPALEGRHPCFSSTPEGHAASARLHLPVSPGCNIACRFCKRDFNRHEQRPGVAARLLTPEQALVVVGRALRLCPNINVVGIAGPGDPLCTPHALQTFRLVHAAYPDLIKCLSTNGLMLPASADDILAAGVSTITVTVNAVDPEIQAEISPTIVYQRQRLEGHEAARRLIANQLSGIALVVARGATVKVNTVLIPGVNDGHVAEVARRVAEAGAQIINVIPLIPQHGFADLLPPDALAVHRAREAARRHLAVFSHCQRCRADACGVPGISDFSAELYGDTLVAEPTFSHG